MLVLGTLRLCIFLDFEGLTRGDYGELGELGS
jgi:hypothetical protein